jgi:SAM-dependent methyltransferase
VTVVGTDEPGAGAKPWWKTVAPEIQSTDLKIDQPHTARMYDYYLGGKDNFPADRAAAEQALAAFPNARTSSVQNRAFMNRVTRHLAARRGIRQFLDIGTGLPTSPNLHEIAQSVAPEAQVVYADNDPIVLTHVRALLTSAPEGRTAYIDADVRRPELILEAPELRATLDLARPVALSMIALAHFLPDEENPRAIISALLDALAPGSYFVLTHATADYDDGMERLAAAYRAQGIPAQARRREEVLRLFEGVDLLEPGLTTVHRWLPEDETTAGLTDAEVSFYGGVGHKK